MTHDHPAAVRPAESTTLGLWLLPRWFAAVGLLAALGSPGLAQTTTVVPARCVDLPGNAALAMPLRWSQGVLQVFVDPPLLPASLNGQALTGVRLRRSTLLGDPANPSLTRTLTVRGGYQPFLAAQMQGTYVQNRPAGFTVLFGPTAVTTTATGVPAPGAAVGEDLLDVDFTTPLPWAAGTLFLEFEVADAPLQLSAAHWVDAVWFPNGTDTGYAVTVGTGACTTRTEPTELRWLGSAAPAPSITGTLEVRGTPPTAGSSVGIVLEWIGFSPRANNFGVSLTLLDPLLVGCHQWAPFEVSWSGTANTAGVYSTPLPLPSTAALGTELGVQAAWLDLSRTGLPLSFSNGLVLRLGPAGVGSGCSTMFFPGAATVSPWPAFVGQMPVLLLEH